MYNMAADVVWGYKTLQKDKETQTTQEANIKHDKPRNPKPAGVTLAVSANKISRQGYLQERQTSPINHKPFQVAFMLADVTRNPKGKRRNDTWKPRATRCNPHLDRQKGDLNAREC